MMLLLGLLFVIGGAARRRSSTRFSDREEREMHATTADLHTQADFFCVRVLR